MIYSLLKQQDYTKMLWKNGKGYTYEIAKDTTQCQEGSFNWRISMAQVDQNGSFSDFSGYQRVISVLEGEGIHLAIDDQSEEKLYPFTAFAFDGASQTQCTLLKDPVTDFNLIYAPQKYRARCQWLNINEIQRFCSQAQTILIFSVCDSMTIKTNQFNETLGKHETLFMTQNESLKQFDLITQANQNHFCCVIELSKI
ncbi:HutD/Ves family protein [Neisseria sp. Ec49-e6-T10]|uniref:HutD/Ves family protein n=1 Tax=Neisseria sp. Ec49-e6-T10 TaxID=3140744 RepID=UPI003EB9F7C3